MLVGGGLSSVPRLARDLGVFVRGTRRCPSARCSTPGGKTSATASRASRPASSSWSTTTARRACAPRSNDGSARAARLRAPARAAGAGRPPRRPGAEAGRPGPRRHPGARRADHGRPADRARRLAEAPRRRPGDQAAEPHRQRRSRPPKTTRIGGSWRSSGFRSTRTRSAAQRSRARASRTATSRSPRRRPARRPVVHLEARSATPSPTAAPPRRLPARLRAALGRRSRLPGHDRRDEDGKRRQAFDIFCAAALGPEAAIGRPLFRRVPSDELDDGGRRARRRLARQREDDESFALSASARPTTSSASWPARAGEEPHERRGGERRRAARRARGRRALGPIRGPGASGLLEWAIERFGPRIAISTAFQAGDVALIDMAYKIDPNVRIFTVDTGRLPQETYELIEPLRERYPGHGLTCSRRTRARCSGSSPARARTDVPVGRAPPALLQRPQGAAADAAPRRPRRLDHRPASRPVGDAHQHPQDRDRPRPRRDREAQPARRVDEGRGLGLRARERRSVHALYAQGYTSIGCAPCTRPIAEASRPRRPLVVGDRTRPRSAACTARSRPAASSTSCTRSSARRRIEERRREPARSARSRSARRRPCSRWCRTTTYRGRLAELVAAVQEGELGDDEAEALEADRARPPDRAHPRVYGPRASRPH